MKISPSIRRWLSLVEYAVLGLWFGFPGGLFYARLWNATNQLWPVALIDLRWYFFVGTSLLLLFVCLKISGVRFRHFQHFWSYPPLLVSVFIAWTLFILGLAYLPQATALRGEMPMTFLVGGTIAMWLVAGLALPLFWRLHVKASHSSATSSKTRDELRNLEFNDLTNWLGDERPIASGGEDYFGAADRAFQVWEAIQSRRSGPSSNCFLPTVVIEGPFGSGKTSIIELLCRRVAEERPEGFIVARVSAWGFSSAAARQFVIEQAVEVLRQRVDCLAVRGLPEAYTNALSEYGTWLQAILYPWTEKRSPVERLQLLTPILKAIDARLIVVIEDSDRSGSDFESAHLQAMLNDFRQVERLSFILTVGSTARIDFPKLAEQIVTVALLPSTDAALFLDRVRDHCRKVYKAVDVVTDKQNRPDSLLADIEASQFVASVISPRGAAWSAAVASILNTPRSLKFTLSSVLRSWTRLHGEVDLDELIVMTALRHAAGPAFSFILRRSFELRLLNTGFSHDDKEDQERRERENNELRSEWQDAISESGADQRALDALLCNLFPKAFAITGRNSWNQTNRIQSINSRRSDVYLERLVSGSLSPNSVRDQEVIASLLSISEGKGCEAFVERFAKSREFAELVMFFDENFLLSDAQRREASAELIQAISKQSGIRRLESHPIHDLFSKWQDRISRESPEFVEWAAQQITQFLPSNLLHVTELWFDLVRDSYLEMEKQIAIRHIMVKAAREQLSILEAEDFSQCFSSNFPYTFGHLIRLDHKSYPAGFLTKYSDWAWMGEMMLKAARLHPETLVPHLVNAFGAYGPQFEVFTSYRFRMEDVADFFGDKAPEFYSLVSIPFIPNPNLDANFIRLFPLAAKEAEALLESDKARAR